MENKVEETKVEGGETAATASSSEVWKNKGKECKAKMCAFVGKNKKTILAILVLVVLIAGSFAFKKYYKPADIGQEAIRAKIQKFVDANVPAGTKTEIKEITKEGDLYKIIVNVNDQDVPLYLTRDGKNLIQQLIDIDKASEKQAEADQPTAEIPKSDKPKVDMYVMSFCPYGNKAEDTMKSVYELLKSKVDFNFRYIVSVNGNEVQSLHGAKEVAQNEREACVMKLSGKDKWMSFVTYVNANCGSDGACWEVGAKTLGLDAARINACVKSDGVALMKTDEKISNEAGASGSPTLKINGVETKAVYQYGNAQAYKEAICGAFNTAPAECSKALASDAATSQGGSCN